MTDLLEQSIFGRGASSPSITPGDVNIGPKSDINAPAVRQAPSVTPQEAPSNTQQEEVVNQPKFKDPNPTEQYSWEWVQELGRGLTSGFLEYEGAALRTLEFATKQIENLGAAIGEKTSFSMDEDNLTMRRGPVNHGLSDLVGVGAEHYAKKAKEVGYVPPTNWEEVQQDPLKFPAYVAETTLSGSLPDMFFMLVSWPAYLMTNNMRMAEERVKNQDRSEVTLGDYFRTAPASVASAYLDKFSLGKTLNTTSQAKGAVGRVIESAGTEYVTEFTQTLIEYFATTLDTNKEADVGEALGQAQIAGMTAAAGAGTINITMTGVEKTTNAISAKVQSHNLKKYKEGLEKSGYIKSEEKRQAAIANLKENGLENVYVDVDHLSVWIEENGSGVLEASQDLMDKMTEAENTGSTVAIDTDTLINHLMTNEAFDELLPNLLINKDGFTENEANDYLSKDLKNDLKIAEEAEAVAALKTELKVDEDPTLKFAEKDLAIDGMVKTAEEAGYTEKEWTQYQEDKELAKQENLKNKQLKDAERAVKKNAKQIKKAQQAHLKVVGEQVRDSQTYHSQADAFDAKLDPTALDDLLKEQGMRKEDLPKYRGNNLYAKPGKGGVDPELFAHFHGYESAQAMVEDWVTAPTITQAIEHEMNKKLQAEYPELFSRQAEVLDARDAVINSKTEQVLKSELEMVATKLGKKGEGLKAFQQLINQAKLVMNDVVIKDINNRKFLQESRRQGKLAGMYWRNGEYDKAFKAKHRQLLTFNLAIQSAKARKRIEKEVAFAQKFLKNKKRFVPGLVDMQEAILDEKDWVDEKGKGGHKANYKEWTYGELMRKVAEVREVAHKTKMAQRLTIAQEKQTVAQVAAKIRDTLSRSKHIAGTNPEAERSWWFGVKKKSREFIASHYHPDTIIRILDEDSQGIIRDHIKKPYDLAMNGGYRGRKGYYATWAEAADNIAKLHKMLPKNIRNNLGKHRLTLSTGDKLNNEQFLSALLNLGNEQNIKVLMESRGFKVNDIVALREQATKEEMDFVQATWDYLDSFFPAIKESQMYRKNKNVEKVQPLELVTSVGTYRGGYYPIMYAKNSAVMLDNETLNRDGIDAVLFGNASSLHTKDVHAQTRTGQVSKTPLRLDLDVLNNHVRNVVYDLEVGDAMVDIYKVLYDDVTKSAFKEHGYDYLWEQLDFFFRDAVTDEIRIQDVYSNVARHLRVGSSLTHLGFNLRVAALQTLGVFNAMPELGVTRTVIASGLSPLTLYHNNKFANEVSGLMRNRSDTYNREANAAFENFANKPHKRIKDYIHVGAYYLMRMFQRVTDLIVFRTAYNKGLRKYENHEQAVDYAERMVVMTQGSGIFGDRSAVERGTTSAKNQQNEWVRLLSFIMSYHIATNNMIRSQAITEGKLKNAMRISMATIIASLPETLLTGALMGDIPEDPEDLPAYMGKAVASKLTAGIVLVNQVSSVVKGFDGGTAVDSWLSNTGKFLVKTFDEETDLTDPDYLKDALPVVGPVVKIGGGSQAKKTIRTYLRTQEGYDTEWWEWILGSPYEKE